MVELLQAYQDSPRYISSEEQIQIHDFIMEHGQVCPVELYRGVPNTSGESYEIGQEIRLGGNDLFESFTEELDVALDFARQVSPAQESNNQPVVLVLENAFGLPLYMHTDGNRESEWLIPYGDFTVKKIETEDGVTFVTICR